jgi:hypothetical protein
MVIIHCDHSSELIPILRFESSDMVIKDQGYLHGDPYRIGNKAVFPHQQSSQRKQLVEIQP